MNARQLLTIRRSQLLYWVIFICLIVLWFCLYRIQGVEWDHHFYTQTSETLFSRRVGGGITELQRTGILPRDGTVRVVGYQEGTPVWEWSIQHTGTQNNHSYSAIVQYGAMSYEVGCDVDGKNAYILSDSMEEYMDVFPILEDMEKAVFLAYGGTEGRGDHGLEFFVIFLLSTFAAWPLLYYPMKLFHFQQRLNWSIKNPEEMKPSGFYFFSSYTSGAFLLVLAVLSYLVSLQIIA